MGRSFCAKPTPTPYFLAQRGVDQALGVPKRSLNQSTSPAVLTGVHGYGRTAGKLQHRHGRRAPNQHGARDRGEAHHYQHCRAGTPHSAPCPGEHSGIVAFLTLSIQSQHSPPTAAYVDPVFEAGATSTRKTTNPLWMYPAAISLRRKFGAISSM